MENDLSNKLYETYFNFKNRNVIIKLKLGQTLQGIIIGFFKDEDLHNYTKWHLVNNNDCLNLGTDTFGFPHGEIIDHKDIASITFLENNITLSFI